MGETYQETTLKEVIQAAARVLAEAALKLVESDPHQWSKRPCQTCAAISTILGKPFGCATFSRLETLGKEGKG